MNHLTLEDNLIQKRVVYLRSLKSMTQMRCSFVCNGAVDYWIKETLVHFCLLFVIIYFHRPTLGWLHFPCDIHLWLYVPAVFETLSSDLRPQAVHTHACRYSMTRGWWVSNFCEIHRATHTCLKRRGGCKGEIASGLRWTSLHPVCDPTVMICTSSQLPTGHNISHKTYRWCQSKRTIYLLTRHFWSLNPVSAFVFATEAW